MDLQDGNAETALHHAVLFSLRKIWDPKRFGFGANYINSGYRNNSQIPLKILAEKDRVSVATFLIAGALNHNFRKNICSEDDLRSRIFGTFFVKFLVCLLLLGFSNI